MSWSLNTMSWKTLIRLSLIWRPVRIFVAWCCLIRNKFECRRRNLFFCHQFTVLDFPPASPFSFAFFHNKLPGWVDAQRSIPIIQLAGQVPKHFQEVGEMVFIDVAAIVEV